MAVGIWILGDQLWVGQAALKSCADRKLETPIILIESLNHVRQRPYHKQKLILVWSAMRHFANELRAEGWSVTYKIADDFTPSLTDWVQQQGLQELRVMAPTDRPFANYLANLSLPCDLTLLPNNQFLWSREAFEDWAESRQSLLMESFYREGRQRFGVLMEGKQPIGGQWNFDQQNRQPPKGKLEPPEPLWFEPDSTTREVIDWVNTLELETFGEAEPFRWGISRSHACQVLNYFIQSRLQTFGPYQDAMVTGAETLWHAMLSPYLNLGLLHPLEVIDAVEQAYHENDLPINSVEGFIRQVLGWREYMHGIYHAVKADYPERNFFNHTQPLPDFFWTADTPMNCLHQTLDSVKRTGYAHHIQRLMVLSNFSLIAGLSPQAVEDWFHTAFIDAYDWVMQTNVIGMGLFADGGVLATKPYASSANYINRMSDYCKGCQYNRKARTGDNACPFNFFYWDFLARHRHQLSSQGRMNFILANLDRMSAEELREIRQRAANWHRLPPRSPLP